MLALPTCCHFLSLMLLYSHSSHLSLQQCCPVHVVYDSAVHNYLKEGKRYTSPLPFAQLSTLVNFDALLMWTCLFSVTCCIVETILFCLLYGGGWTLFLVVFVFATRFCWRRSLVDFSFSFLTVSSEVFRAFCCFCWKFSCQLNLRWLSYGETLFFLLRFRLSFVLLFSTLAMPYPCVERQVLIFLGAHWGLRKFLMKRTIMTKPYL